MFALLNDGGMILLSGILHEDVENLTNAIKAQKGKVLEVRQRDKWVLMVAAKIG
jgi:ribosomal protein L11 methylase PrmA